MTKKDPFHLLVRNIVKKDVVAVSAEDTLQTALDLMAENRVTALPVLDGQGRCEGMLSASDLVEMTRDLNLELRDLGRTDEDSYQWIREHLEERDMQRHTVGDYMTREVATITGSSTLTDAARAMLQHRVHRLPVVDRQGEVVGIISTTDILTAFVEGAPAPSSMAK
jgi:CBS domain-containing protein